MVMVCVLRLMLIGLVWVIFISWLIVVCGSVMVRMLFLKVLFEKMLEKLGVIM